MAPDIATGCIPPLMLLGAEADLWVALMGFATLTPPAALCAADGEDWGGKGSGPCDIFTSAWALEAVPALD